MTDARTPTRRWALRPAVTAVALLAASASSALVATTPASAASCPISVSDFGHNLEAVHKAMKSMTATCRTILFTPGEYALNDQYRIAATSVKVIGQPGAVIKPAAGTKFRGGLIQISGANVSVSGLTIIGSPSKGIEAHRAENFELSDNTIRDSGTLGIHLLGSDRGTVTNNTVTGSRSNGIDMHGATYVVVRGNKVYLNGGPRLKESERNEGNGILAYCSQHIDILSNTVYNNSQTQPGSRDGIRMSDSRKDPTEMPTRYITVDGNIIYDDQGKGTQDYAIHVGGSSVKEGEGTIDFVTVTNNRGWGNLHSGIRTNGLARGATFKQSNNDLTSR